ncbi:MAG: glycerophosphodiester phosphodiesterase family protein [Planctomycetota bacterium]
MTRTLLAALFSVLFASPALAQLVIAHRGASSYLPEHTLEAYALGYGMGADYIEPDVVLSRDGVLICAHDLVMEDVTDVEEKFPDRARADGSWYWIDFDLDEIRTLWKTGRRGAEDSDDTKGYRVATLDEMIELVQRLNRQLSERTGCVVGVIPEPKSPSFHRAEGQPIEVPLVQTLARFGYKAAADEAIIQCFDLDSLELMHKEGCELRLVWLLGDRPSNADLRRAAAFCHGLGPNRKLLEDESGRGSPFLGGVRTLGLALYPYTFKDEPEAMFRFFGTHRVEGLFTDNPDVGLRARRMAR